MSSWGSEVPIHGLTFDTGALISLESGHANLRSLLRLAKAEGIRIHIPAGVVAQAWRGDGARQALIARLLSDPLVAVPPLDELTARAVGVLCSRAGHFDVVDGQVALDARQNGHKIVTSDPDDMRALYSDAQIIPV